MFFVRIVKKATKKNRDCMSRGDGLLLQMKEGCNKFLSYSCLSIQRPLKSQRPRTRFLCIDSQKF